MKLMYAKRQKLQGKESITTPDGNTIPIGYLYNREFTYDNYDEEACAYEIEVEETPIV